MYKTMLKTAVVFAFVFVLFSICGGTAVVNAGERPEAEKEEAIREGRKLKEALDEVDEAIARTQNEIREIELQLERREMNDEERIERKRRLEQHYRDLKKLSVHREEVIKRLRELGWEYEGRKGEPREKKRDIDQRIRELKERIAGHEAELKEARQHRKELEYKLERHEMGPEDRAHLKRQLEECLACLEENERGLVEAKEELAHLLREIGHDEGRERREKPRDIERGGEREKIKGRLDEMHGHIRKLEGQADECERHIKELHRRLDREEMGEDDRRELREKLNRAVNEFEGIMASIEEVRAQIRHFEVELEEGERRERPDREFEAEIRHGEEADEWVRELLSEKNRERLLRAINDAFGDDFMDMRRHNLERFVMEHLDIIGELFELSFEDEYAYKLVVRGFQLEREIGPLEEVCEELGHGIRGTDNKERRREWMDKLEKVLNELFELKLEFEELEIKHTEHILEKAHIRLKKRRENRGKIIEKRYRELTGQEEDHEW